MDFLDLYSMINKRKSHRDFDETRKLDVDTLKTLIASYDCLVLSGEKPSVEVVEASTTSCSRGNLCICYYGAKDEEGLLDAGYYLEQLDLFLQEKGIGICWYGFGRTKTKKLDDKDFVIMLNAGYAKKDSLRSDVSEFKRNDSSFWKGEFSSAVISDVRLAPSACNTQPWLVECKDNTLIVKIGKGNASIMVGKIKDYFNLIDMGIFLCFLDLSLKKHGYEFKRELLIDDAIARYTIV